jgi:hypothetical protein
MNRFRPFPWSPRAAALAAVWLSASCDDHTPERVEQTAFPTPEDAVTALVAGIRANDAAGLAAILGPESDALLSSGDAVADKAAREKFLAVHGERNGLEKVSDSEVILNLGERDWPFPIPLVKVERGWIFDTEAGVEEVLNRRIGANELSTIQVCLAYVDAQREYAYEDHDGDGLPEYAQKVLSTPGKKDGLYWESKEGEPQSPLGPLVAGAVTEGYSRTTASEKPSPYHGYHFRMLKAQGEHAPGGAYDYMVGGNMISGFACIAYPAEYGSSGIKTFVVNHDGVVHEKDLGEETKAAGERMTLYDPDVTWTKSPR